MKMPGAAPVALAGVFWEVILGVSTALARTALEWAFQADELSGI